jgi:hypothetical protein
MRWKENWNNGSVATHSRTLAFCLSKVHTLQTISIKPNGGNMRTKFTAIFATTLLCLTPFAFSQDVAHDVDKAAKDTGHATKTAAKDTAKGTEKAADKTGHATKTVAKKTGHATKTAAKDTAKDTKKAADKTADAVK